MQFDSGLMFSNRQSIVATTNSIDVVDLGQPYETCPADLAISVTVQAEGGTSPTLTVELEHSSNNSTFTKVVGFAKPAGKKGFSLQLGGLRLSRYVRLNYVLGGSSPTFTVTAGIVTGWDQNYPPADSIRIS